jgi:FdhD protein
MGQVTQRRRVLRVDADRTVERPDTLAVEEPLEIRVGGRPLTVTMRTPGNDIDLALGFLVTEGLTTGGADIRNATACADNVVDVTLADGLGDLSVSRNFYATSSCGLCGKASIDAVRTTSSYDVRTDPVVVDSTALVSLPEKLRAEQRGFDRTGGLHAAGLFTRDGALLCLREDVGRHNAVDKVVGWAAQHGRLPLEGCVLQVSGRASFELVQKSVMAGIPVLAAVSAPSSLAVDLAEEMGLTLVGFLRGTSYNVYSGAHRVHGQRRTTTPGAPRATALEP